MKLIDAQTVELTVSFTEPVTSVDGSALSDLAYSTIYIKSPAGTLKSPVIHASSSKGGGDVSTTIQVNAPANVVTTLALSVTATDLSGNEGPWTDDVIKVIDRVGPAAPTNFTIG